MLGNDKLAKSLSDASFGEIKTKIEYKAHELKLVDRFYPSTRTCCVCGKVHDMTLKDREMMCECGNRIDRDLNAANNICRQGMSTTDVDSEALATSKEVTKLYGVETFNSM